MRKAAALASLIIILLLALGLAGPTASWLAQPSGDLQPFEFALIGDLQYSPQEEWEFANVMAEIDAAPLAFVVHAGDFLGSLARGGGGICSDQKYAQRLAEFQDSAYPFIYTPGDNDWTDCHEARFGGVEVFGSPDSHWVHATVDYNDPSLFVFRPRLVRANLTSGQ